jgi:hypothetical protein
MLTEPGISTNSVQVTDDHTARRVKRPSDVPLRRRQHPHDTTDTDAQRPQRARTHNADEHESLSKFALIYKITTVQSMLAPSAATPKWTHTLNA